MVSLEETARRIIENNLRKIYAEIEKTENDEVYNTFRTNYSEFTYQLTDRVRGLIRESRKILADIKKEDTKNIYIEWQIKTLADYFMDCLKAKEILEFENYE